MMYHGVLLLIEDNQGTTLTFEDVFPGSKYVGWTAELPMLPLLIKLHLILCLIMRLHLIFTTLEVVQLKKKSMIINDYYFKCVSCKQGGGGASNASNCLVPLIMSAKENHTQT
jgi:hypothetical protein